jgi:hypothetical protein
VEEALQLNILLFFSVQNTPDQKGKKRVYHSRDQSFQFSRKSNAIQFDNLQPTGEKECQLAFASISF